MTILHGGALTAAALSGAWALAAIVAGSPLPFGVALAMCGAWWVVADFIESTVESKRAYRRRAFPVARIDYGHGSCRVVFVGRKESAYRSGHRVGSGSRV
jgi:hypothetical protein